MSDKPPLDFLLDSLYSLIECIHEHYGPEATDGVLIGLKGEEE